MRANPRVASAFASTLRGKLVGVAALIAGGGLACASATEQSEACRTMIDCYFGDNPLPNDAELGSLRAQTPAVLAAYGQTGTCWDDLDGAALCTQRCEDIHATYCDRVSTLAACACAEVRQ